MTAVDTNILVRLVVGDRAVQARASRQLFETDSIFIPDTVLLETEWVLRAAYGFDAQTVCAALRGICGLATVTLEDPQRVAQAIDWHEQGFDFADAFHLASCPERTTLKTFDAAFIRSAKRHTERRVERP